MESTILRNKSEIKESDNSDIYILDSDEKTARSILESLKQKNIKKKIAILGRDNNFNRRALETLKIDFLISPERELPKDKKKDTLKQRDSGLNHVLAKIAKEKNISIIIDFNDFNSIKDKKQKSLRLARIIQNIEICRKAKCNVLICDFSNQTKEKELRAFGFSIGMSSQQVKNCII